MNFNPSFTKMYLATNKGGLNGNGFMSTVPLSTAGDVTTANFNSVSTINTGNLFDSDNDYPSVEAFSFNGLGNKVYLTDPQFNSIIVTSLSPSYTFNSNTSRDYRKYLGDQVNYQGPITITFNKNRDNYLTSSSNYRNRGKLYQYSLSSRNDIESSTLIATSPLLNLNGANQATLQGVQYNSDGTSIYVVTRAKSLSDTNLSPAEARNINCIAQFKLKTPYKLSSLVNNPTSTFYFKSDPNLEFLAKGSPNDLIISNDGKKMYVPDASTNNIYEFYLKTAYDLSTIYYVGDPDICFCNGSVIKTDQGEISIEKLTTEHTIRRKPILAIPRSKSVSNSKDMFLVCFEKDALGENVPNKKTLMTHNHKILYKDELIETKKLLKNNPNKEKIYKVKYNGQMLHNILLPNYSKVVVNNIVAETLHPENPTAKKYL